MGVIGSDFGWGRVRVGSSSAMSCAWCECLCCDVLFCNSCLWELLFKLILSVCSCV